MELAQFLSTQSSKLTGEFAADSNDITSHCPEGVFVWYFGCSLQNEGYPAFYLCLTNLPMLN